MGYWNTRGLRGSTLEEMINITNDFYSEKGLALIKKVPTPITPIAIDNKTRTITKAFFEQKGTVDYIGVVQGIAVCFDAKETTRKMLPLQNIHPHQIEFMEKFQIQKGISFLIVSFQFIDEIFYLPFDSLKKYWDEAQKGGRKSIPYEAFEKDLIIKSGKGVVLNYLEAINTYLMREE